MKEKQNIAKDKIRKQTSKYRINNQIKSQEVRLIDENGNQKGILKIENALDYAEKVGLDLIEISPNGKPPVCKILNFGKFKYEIEKQIKLNKKKQHIVHVKEIRLRPNTDDHDLITKLNKAEKFLNNGDKLKITILLRGREILNRKEAGKELIERVIEILKDISMIDKPIDIQGRRLSVVLSPK